MSSTISPLSRNTASVTAVTDECLVLIVNTNGKIREHVSGEPAEFLANCELTRDTSIGDFLPPELTTALKQNMRRSLRSRQPYRLGAQIHNAGATAQIEIQVLPHGRDSAILLVRDCTSRAKLAAHVHDLAFRDALTGLPNAAALFQMLSEALTDAQLRRSRLAVARIRLSSMRSVNHTFGRDAGNALLIECAARLAPHAMLEEPRLAELGKSLDLRLARTRGDEFSLLVQGIASADCVANIADVATSLVVAPFSGTGTAISAQCNVGIAMYPAGGDEPESLLGNADIALAEAMAHGENTRRFFSGNPGRRKPSQLDLEQELRWALGQEQFTLSYQPCLDFASGRIVSVEALLRWQHPLRGDVPVNEIIPLAEMSDLDAQIGTWVIEQACKAAGQCKQITDICVSLNLGARHAVSRNTPQRIADQIESFDLLPRRMLLEIKASDYLRGRSTMQSSVSALADRGIGVVLDDFRAGSMHLASLDLPGIRALKISRSLIAALPTDESARRCTAAIIAMARALGITSSATGVETDAQYNLLAEMGCDTYQGFLHSAPVPLDALLQRLRLDHKTELAG